jgi:hypothetical protein
MRFVAVKSEAAQASAAIFRTNGGSSGGFDIKRTPRDIARRHIP